MLCEVVETEKRAALEAFSAVVQGSGESCLSLLRSAGWYEMTPVGGRLSFVHENHPDIRVDWLRGHYLRAFLIDTSGVFPTIKAGEIFLDFVESDEE